MLATGGGRVSFDMWAIMINGLIIVLAIVARPQAVYNQSNTECVNPKFIST